MQKSPLAIVKERFGDKASLVKAIEGLATDSMWIDRTNDSKGLSCVSNRKLLRLHQVLTDLQKEFGGRDALVQAIIDQEGRGKDGDFKNGLARMPTPKLYDRFRAGKKRAGKKAA